MQRSGGSGGGGPPGTGPPGTGPPGTGPPGTGPPGTGPPGTGPPGTGPPGTGPPGGGAPGGGGTGPLPAAAAQGPVPVAAPGDIRTMGTLPQIFTGNRAKAQDFLDEVLGYFHANRGVAGFESPMCKVSITFISKNQHLLFHLIQSYYI